MRKIVAGLYISLDGVVEEPQAWFGPYNNEEVGQEVGSMIAAGDTLLLGRNTYQTFAGAFGGETGGMADVMNTIPKVVVSATLQTAEWQNSTLIKGDVATAVTALKQQPGKNINMSGSVTLVRWLLHAGLLDELHLLVFPIVAGRGKRLFVDGEDMVGLTLVEAKTFSTGVVALTYAPAGARNSTHADNEAA